MFIDGDVVAPRSRAKVYYNSACPVCAAGIRRQRARLDRCGEALEWIDVHADNDAVSDVGASLEFVRERLHVIDADGNVHLGADAIAELMAMTPGQRMMARLAGLPVVRNLLRVAYTHLRRRSTDGIAGSDTGSRSGNGCARHAVLDVLPAGDR